MYTFYSRATEGYISSILLKRTYLIYGTEPFRNLFIPKLRNGTECSVICSYLNYGTELTELAYFYQI